MTALPQLVSPSLENGDQLSREEFHRRYTARPDLQHVQLIEGIVYMPSPLRFTQHGGPQALVIGWLTAYAASHPEVEASGPATVILDERNEPEPDALLIRTGAAASTFVGSDGYLRGAPELVVEIAATSATIDLGPKLEAYRRNGVREYVVWLVQDAQIRWHTLEGDAYALREPVDGILTSTGFPGLRLDVKALLAGDAAAVLRALGTR